MSKINRVEIHEFSFDIENLGLEQATTGVGNMAYVAGDKLKAFRYAVNIKTDDGLQGEYVTHWGGDPIIHGPIANAGPSTHRAGSGRT